MREEQRRFLDEIRARHPQRKSLSGALLDEILTGSDDRERGRAAIHFGQAKYRRGLGQLEGLVDRLTTAVEAVDDEWIGPPERNLLGSILIGIGFIDTDHSHSILARLATRSTSHLVRADALEGMAFEKKQFDWELILPFLSEACSTPEILSALYAIQYRKEPKTRTDQARELIVPLLGHSYRLVRSSSIAVLQLDASNRELISGLAEDPDEQVQEAVEYAMEYIENGW